MELADALVFGLPQVTDLEEGLQGGQCHHDADPGAEGYFIEQGPYLSAQAK